MFRYSEAFSTVDPYCNWSRAISSAGNLRSAINDLHFPHSLWEVRTLMRRKITLSSTMMLSCDNLLDITTSPSLSKCITFYEWDRKSLWTTTSAIDGLYTPIYAWIDDIPTIFAVLPASETGCCHRHCPSDDVIGQLPFWEVKIGLTEISCKLSCSAFSIFTFWIFCLPMNYLRATLMR